MVLQYTIKSALHYITQKCSLLFQNWKFKFNSFSWTNCPDLNNCKKKKRNNLFFSSPCNQILMARSSIPKTNKYIISIKPSRWQLNLKERFWVIGVNISYLNYFGWSFQGKINSFAVFTGYNSMFFINGYGPVLDIELGSMFRMSQTIHYNALMWKKNVLVWFSTFQSAHKV